MLRAALSLGHKAFSWVFYVFKTATWKAAKVPQESHLP